ncbi:MAG: cupin domain-containing protein [Acidobacteriaceae bacterium]|nr:cupin domain-containing protein [Acidobacteriaceae bacterium]
MRRIAILLGIAGLTLAADQKVDIYSANDLADMTHKLAQKRAPFAAVELKRYGNHYTMLAHREATGSAEVHEHEADIFVIEGGEATIVTGGNVMNPRTEKAGEIRGSSIEGGERHLLRTGDIIHIPAGVPHQLLIETAKPFTYFVIKATGQ